MNSIIMLNFINLYFYVIQGHYYTDMAFHVVSSAKAFRCHFFFFF